MLFITLGDPYSINVEVLCSLQKENECFQKTPVVIMGSEFHWNEQVHELGVLKPQNITFIDISDPTFNIPTRHLTPKQRGTLSIRALEKSIEGLKSNPHIKKAVLTLPIDKSCTYEAGWNFPGQTEFFAASEHVEHPLMYLRGSELKVSVVTHHTPLQDVPAQITPERVKAKITKLADALLHLEKIPAPHIAVCGLNPHCGDKGAFGYGEENRIREGIELYSQSKPATHDKVQITGPVSADTAFYFAKTGVYSAVLAQYHDQGLAPFKLAHFYDGVNITWGLSYLRVAPDHGPASGLFMKKKANTDSLRACFDILIKYLT